MQQVLDDAWWPPCMIRWCMSPGTVYSQTLFTHRFWCTAWSKFAATRNLHRLTARREKLTPTVDHNLALCSFCIRGHRFHTKIASRLYCRQLGQSKVSPERCLSQQMTVVLVRSDDTGTPSSQNYKVLPQTKGVKHHVHYATEGWHQKEFTAETVYTRQRLHQTPYTPDTVYTRRRLHQTKPTKVYTRKSLHHRQFTPDSVYTRHRLHQTWFTPDMVETIAVAIIRRLATKDCKTPRNYALNDDTGTPSSQNYKANSNQSV